MCPNCRQNAPLVYRGVAAYCAACGAPRLPLTGSAVALAGQPSKVGGTVTRVFGWMVLVGGLLTAALLDGCLAAIEAPTSALLWVGIPVAAISLVLGFLLLRGGKSLQKSGDDAAIASKNQAIFALATNRGGVLRAWDVSQALAVTPQEGDELLTRLAKEDPDRIAVDVDDEGNVLYRFVGAHWAATAAVAAAPTMAPNAPPPVRGSRSRVAGGAPPVPSAYGARVADPVRVETREPLPLDEEPVEPETARQRS